MFLSFLKSKPFFLVLCLNSFLAYTRAVLNATEKSILYKSFSPKVYSFKQLSNFYNLWLFAFVILFFFIFYFNLFVTTRTFNNNHFRELKGSLFTDFIFVSYLWNYLYSIIILSTIYYHSYSYFLINI